MGLYWSFTMPLLSTLAALVIIVHSAEEDLDEFRRDLRPRASDTGTTNYELPWRAVRAEPMMTQSTQTDTWDGSPEDQPKRRRPSRKRRRRPQPSSEVFARQEGYSEQREYPYNGENYRPFTQIPQRRRKKIEPKQKDWGNEPVESGRPSRRKGVRRKANADEPWRELSEFGDPPLEEYVETNEGTNQKPESTNYEPDFENNDGSVPQLTLNHFFKDDEKGEVTNQEVTKDARSYEESEDDPAQLNKENEYDENLMLQVKEDKSLSEFSMEINDSARTSKNRSDQAKPFKGNFNDLKEQRPLDPSSLKEILKKSKGKSLSELLQQHNLTLADLLNGEKKVLSVLKSSDTLQNNKQVADVPESLIQVPIIEEPKASIVSEAKVSDQNVEEPTIVHNKPLETTTSESPFVTKNIHVIKKIGNEPQTALNASLSSMGKGHKFNINVTTNNHHSDKVKLNETNKNFLRRRLPVGIRMKLRMRPLNSNSYKGQLSRDLMALSTKKFHHNRNLTKLRDWKDIIPAVVNKTQKKTEDKQNIYNNGEENNNSTTTTTSVETTVDDVTTDNSIYTDNESEMQTEETNTKSVSTTTTPKIEATTAKVTTTLKPMVFVAPRLNTTSLRHQAFTNRLRRKKLRQKALMNDTIEGLDQKLKDIFDMANLVSASEFIARIQQNPTTASDETETATTLEDFMTTETTTKAVTQTSTKRYITREKPKTSSTTPQPTTKTSTTETAKIEIEEILYDASARDKLSRILMERNMTLSELVEHRERGSSHVHLADIFHNASKEPNPPEPFLSKSLIEPISKETYPLRALLEANLHEQTVKPTTVEPYLFPLHYINIPIAMDFGNNVNENSENSGIIALFNNFTTAVQNQSNEVDLNKSNEEANGDVANSTSRESKVFNTEQDLISLNEIFSLMQKTRNHRQEPQVSSEVSSSNKSESDSTVEDVDGDGLIALEDLQQIKNMKVDKDFYTDKVESKLLENIEDTATMNTPETIHNNTRSVTVVTASIVGLIAVLFLVTYAAFKWKHQQQVFQRKHCTSEDRIPTPVFENRKSNKNSSMRSLSPMLSSNIYSVNTLEKPNNNECPEYMWDSLRKPFQ